MLNRTAGLRARLGFALVAWAAWAAVPTPESHFGHKIGADRKVLDWDKVVSYFQALERNSDRILVKELGKSTEGRPFIAATIASPATLKRLDRYQWIQKKLADPRQTPEAEAGKLVAEGKSVVLITCSIHATEIGAVHAAVELSYKLLTEDTPKHRAILDNVVFLLVPSLNPDGLDLVTQWYRKTLNTPFEGTSPPELYQKYVGHDNNRDWYIFSQAETRHTIAQLHNVWHPQIVYDLHQQSPFGSRMFLPPWIDPIEPNIDPILVALTNMIGTGMAADLTTAGKTGVLINSGYDLWSPSRHYQAYHGGMRILSEAASARLASPIQAKPGQGGASEYGGAPRERSWNYPEPWTGGEWRLRDIIDYELIAMESCLYQAAIRREDLLRGFYRIGQRAVARRSPAAFVISALQPDPGATRKLLETLAFGLVEMEQAGAAFEAGGKKYPAGSYVIRMQQPYSSWAKTLLERQRYPDLRQYPGGPPRRPYDVTAHTLPLLMGVEAEALEALPPVALRRAAEFKVELSTRRPPFGGLPASDTDTWRAVNRLWAQGRPVWRDVGVGDFFPEYTESRNLKELKRPRLGLYKNFVPSMDEGWTRWILEQLGFAYQSVGNREILAGAQGLEVVVFPDQRAESMVNGYQPGSMPEEYTGGLGEKGAQALRQFARAGGTLVFLNHAAEYATEHLGVDLKKVLRGVSSRDFYSPGSLLNVTLDGQSPLAYGLPGRMALWSECSPAWEVPEGSPARVIARYPEKDVLASGWLLGEKYLAGKAAIVEYPLGAGRVILFGCRPQYRAQSYQAFKLLFNAIAGR
jgi:hypothetical protein